MRAYTSWRACVDMEYKSDLKTVGPLFADAFGKENVSSSIERWNGLLVSAKTSDTVYAVKSRPFVSRISVVIR
jgi:hypothetical protein